MKPVVNAAYCKKLQSQIKSIIQNFGKFIQLWNSDTAQISILLDELNSLNSEWMSVVANINQSSPNHIVSGDLMIEIEHIFSQLKTFEKRLTDVVNAMAITIHDTFKLITNEPVEVFPEDSIFTADHLLDMQDMYRNYSLELSRKSELLRNIWCNEVTLPSSLMDNERLLSEVTSELISREQKGNQHFNISKEGLNRCIELWSDESECSLVHTKAISVFVTKNNLSSPV